MTHPLAAPYTTRAHPNRTLAILGISALAFALAQTTVIPAIATLGKDLHASPDKVAWALTGYLVAAAVLTPVMGRLGDMFGKRRILVVALLIFAGGSAVSALGSTVWIVVAGRVLQGAGGGIFPLCFGIVRDEFPRERVGRSIGLLAATAGIGGGLGLPLGGIITDHASYHYIFWVGTLIATIAAIATHFLIPESPTRVPGRVDVRGAVVLGFGISIPLIAISRASTWGWLDPKFLALVGLGLLILVGFLALEKRTTDPLVDVDTLRMPPVLITNIATMLIGFGMFSLFLLVPAIAEAPTSSGYGFGVDATRAGLLLVPGSLFMLVAGPLSGVMGNRFGNKVPLAIGSLVAAAGLVLMGSHHASQLQVMLLSLVTFAGIGMAFAATPNLIVDAVPITQTGQATGVNNLLRSVGSSLGSQVVASILAASIVGAVLLPSNEAITTSFVLSGIVVAIAGIVAIVIPRPDHHIRPSVGEELGAASPLGEPAVPEPV